MMLLFAEIHFEYKRKLKLMLYQWVLLKAYIFYQKVERLNLSPTN